MPGCGWRACRCAPYRNVDARSAPAWLGLAEALDMSGRGEEECEARRRAAELEARK